MTPSEDREVEMIVVAAPLRDPATLQRIIEAGVHASDFDSRVGRAIFKAEASLYRKQLTIDPKSLNLETKAIGAEIKVSEILEIQESWIDGFNLDFHIQHLKTLSRQRKLRELVNDQSIELSDLKKQIDEVLDTGKDTLQKIELPTFAQLSAADVRIEYLAPGIPRGAIILIIGPGGIGKTYLCLQLGSRIADGKPFAGQVTVKALVYYLDYENSLATLCERAKVLGPSSMQVWHISNPVPLPRLDSDKWVIFKQLPPGVLIIDTFRACHLLDENSSKDMALLMGRLKELREIGFTVVLIHHTPKSNDKTYKGSTAILDLCDHALVLERVRAIGSDQTADDEDESLPFRLGTRQKTRFEPYKVYLQFDPHHGFSSAGDPDEPLLTEMSNILSAANCELNQTAFFERARFELGVTKPQFRKLLRKGKDRFWQETKGLRNASLYLPKSVFQSKNQASNSAVQQGQESLPFKHPENTEFSSFPEAKKTTQKTGEFQFSSFPPPFRGGKTEQLEQLERSDYDDLGEIPVGAECFRFGPGNDDDLTFKK